MNEQLKHIYYALNSNNIMNYTQHILNMYTHTCTILYGSRTIKLLHKLNLLDLFWIMRTSNEYLLDINTFPYHLINIK